MSRIVMSGFPDVLSEVASIGHWFVGKESEVGIVVNDKVGAYLCWYRHGDDGRPKAGLPDVAMSIEGIQIKTGENEHRTVSWDKLLKLLDE